MIDDKSTRVDAAGLDMHGAEPVTHRFTTTDPDGNADVEFNIVMPLSPTRHAQLEHLLEERFGLRHTTLQVDHIARRSQDVELGSLVSR